MLGAPGRGCSAARQEVMEAWSRTGLREILLYSERGLIDPADELGTGWQRVRS